MPRVVSGRYRGTVLAAPKGDNTRPTTDKVKEALFSIIQTRVPGSVFLDLFSGTGQIGIEAVSRGAERAVLVEKNGGALNIIRQNLAKIRADEDEIKVMKNSAEGALELLAAKGEKFDIIFMDPPYKIAGEQAIKAAALIKKHGLLSEDGILIVEHSDEFPLMLEDMALEHYRSCSYGITVITFFK